MKVVTRILGCVVFVILAGFAPKAVATSHDFGDFITHAQKVQQDAELLSQHLRSKQVDRQMLYEKTGVVAEDIDRLTELVAEFESGNPSLSDAQKKDWELLKTKDRKSTRLNSSHIQKSRMPSSA